ncbi:hypothetical protein [Haloarchaeobius sp. DFWS5]|uniref:hypothetical protein n=1 Tax=Haloarchaeobius sp. DFWS5 TaxID=3446114 RepID=UPI003EBDF9EB
MGADRHWFGVELTAGGDPDTVIDTVERGTDRVAYLATHNDVLAFGGIEYSTRTVVESLESVIEHVSRVALVHVHDGVGAVSAAYYEREGTTLAEHEQLNRDAGTMPDGFFDYFATKYGIHAVI